jgi:hypothetical protein
VVHNPKYSVFGEVPAKFFFLDFIVDNVAAEPQIVLSSKSEYCHVYGGLQTGFGFGFGVVIRFINHL